MTPRVRYEPICTGVDIEVAHLGTVEIWRVSPRGYLFQIRNPRSWWKPKKSLLAAKNGLERELADWLRDTGLAQREDIR